MVKGAWRARSMKAGAMMVAAVFGAGSAAQAQQVLSAVNAEQLGNGPEETVYSDVAGQLAQSTLGGVDTRALTDYGVNKIYAGGAADYQKSATSAWTDSYTVQGTGMVTVTFSIAVDGLANFSPTSDAAFNFNIYALRGTGWTLNGTGGTGPNWYSAKTPGDDYSALYLQMTRADGSMVQADARSFDGFYNYAANPVTPELPGAFQTRVTYTAIGDYYSRWLNSPTGIAEQRFYADHVESWNSGNFINGFSYSVSPSALANRQSLEANYSLLGMATLCAGGECPAGVYPGTDLTVSFTLAAGTKFSLASILTADDLGDGTIDFFNTAKISGVEVSAGGAISSDSGALTLKDDGSYSFKAVDALATPPVPEPASWVMMIGGFALAGAAMRRRKAETVAFVA